MITRAHSLKRLASIGVVLMCCAGLASCGGGGGSRPVAEGNGDQMVIMPPERPSDHSDTPAGATPVALGESFQGRIDSPNDVDYFRLRVDAPGTLTIRTTGDADPDIAVFDGGGLEVPGVTGSWMGTITQEILDKGALLVKVSGGNAGQEYTASATLAQISQSQPDLTVGSQAVSNSRPAAGARFTLSATVSNVGGKDAAATPLRYFRSTDATITTADTAVGTAAVAELTASGSSSQSVDLTAPATPGPYYYGACVDAVAGESDTTNNCSTSVQVMVSETEPELQGQPDLVVGTPTVNDASPETGASFTLSAKVSNAGDGGAVATMLRYYQSTDATITTADTAVGTVAVSALSASGSASQSVELTAPATAGPYYYGACVDGVTDESDTTNNCSSSVKVDVEAPKYPDLVVGTPTVNDVNPETGANFTLSATVSNTGDGDAAVTTLRYYRSTDATITTADTAVGTAAVAELTASGSSSQSVDLTAPATADTYYYGACVEAVTDESDTTNNCSTAVTVTVAEFQLQRESYPDLEVGTPTVDDTSPAPEATITLSATVSNTGDGEAPATTLRYYRSTDATIATTDTQVGTDAIGELAGSGTSSESVELTAPATPGTYYYGACVDAVTDESDTTNNCSASVQVTVTLAGPRVEVSPRSLHFSALGSTETVTVRVLDENGEEDEDATFIPFSLFQPTGGIGPPIGNGGLDIKRVDGGIEVTANGNGSGKISISSGDAHRASLTVSVWQQAATLEVTPDSVSLAVDGTATLTAKAKDSNGNALQVADRNQGGVVVYWSTDDATVATVKGHRTNDDGTYGTTATVTAAAVGTATITGKHGDLTDTATVTVTE